MFDDVNDEDAKEEWQKDLKSWKNRRRSVSSAKRETSEESPEPAQSARSLKNRKWNKYNTVDNDDYDNSGKKDDYDDDDTTKFTRHHYQHSRSMTDHTSLASPSSSSSSSWPPKNAKSVPASEQNGDTNAGNYQAENAQLSAVDSGHSTDEAFSGNKTFQEKSIKISQRPNNPKGFGFEIKGGRENNEPISIGKVSRGSSGDINDLRVGDIILSLNGVDVNHHYMDSVERFIKEAVEKGTIELKIKRFRSDDVDDVLSDDEDFEVRQRTPSLMWSGSVSSRHSTPPLPPQPDYNEGFVEPSPSQHLPLAPPPPPPVNWSTFPEGQKIEDFDFNGTCAPKLEANAQPTESHEATPTSIAQLGNSQQSNYNKSYIPSHDTSLLSTSSSSSNQIRESQTVKRFEFLGLEPAKSEELKVLKEAKIPTQISKHIITNYETKFPSVVEKEKPPSSHVQDFVIEKHDSSSKQLKADIYNSGRYRALFSDHKNKDDSSQLKSYSTDKNAFYSKNHKSPSDRSSYDVIKSKFEFDDKHAVKGQQMHQADSSSKKLLEYNGKQAQSRPLKVELKHSRSEDQSRKQFETQTVKLSSNIGETFPTIYSTTHALTERENIDKFETGRNAAAEWKKRDKEMKEKEDKEHCEMLKRQNDFNRENNFSHISSEIPSKTSVSLTTAKTTAYNSFVKNSTASSGTENQTEVGTTPFTYAWFTSNNKTEKDKGVENAEQPKSEAVSSSKIVDNSTSFMLETSKSSSARVSVPNDASFTTSVKLSDAAFGLKTTQYKPIKLNLDGSSSSSSAISSIKLNNSSFRPSFMSDPEAKENMIRNEIEQNLTLSEHPKESVQSHKPAVKEQPSYQYKDLIKPNIGHLDSLREEEMKLQKIREEQEIEKIRLERIQAEKKNEELKLLRLKEEEEMKKLKEQRKLKEEAEFKKIEMQRAKHEEDAYEKYAKTESGTYILSSSDILKTSYPPINQNAITAATVISNAPKPFQSINKPGPLSFEGNEGNSYSRATRKILTDAGLTYDKTHVQAIMLEKPNFHNDAEKNQETLARNDRDNFYGTKVFPAPTLHTHLQNHGDSRSNAQEFPQYSSSNFESTDSRPVVQQAGSYSVSNPGKGETRPNQPSNISYLLYGESHKEDQNRILYGRDNDVASNSNKSYHPAPFNKSNTLGPSRDESKASNSYDTAKQLSNHWIIKEASKRMGVVKDESTEPSNLKKEASNYISTAVASFRERSKSGTFLAEPKQISEASFVRLRPQQARRESSSSYNFDGSHPKPDHHSPYGHQQIHHSRSSSIPVVQDSNTLALRGESFSATSRLYPENRLSTSGLENSAKLFAGNSPTQHYGGSSFYSPSSAVDSLFTYNYQVPGYIANQQEPNQRQSNFQQPIQLSSRKISLSTANLKQDYDAYENKPNRSQYQSDSRTNSSQFQYSPRYGNVAPTYGHPNYVSPNENDDRFSTRSNYYDGNNNTSVSDRRLSSASAMSPSPYWRS